MPCLDPKIQEAVRSVVRNLPDAVVAQGQPFRDHVTLSDSNTVGIGSPTKEKAKNPVQKHHVPYSFHDQKFK